MHKIAILTNRIPVYRLPIFTEIQNQNPYLDLVFFLSEPSNLTSNDAKNSLKLVFSKSYNISYKTRHQDLNTSQTERLPLPVGLVLDLIKYKPDIIISGEMGTRSLLAFVYSKLFSTPLIIWSEEISSSAISISRIQKFLRKHIFRYAHGYLAWGAPAKDYLISELGIDSSKIYKCSQAVDNQFWQSNINYYKMEEIKSELALKGKTALLVGRLVERKGFDKFLQAWSKLPADIQASNSIIIIGSGSQESNLKLLSDKYRIPNCHFCGSKTMQELPNYYALADFFVFPSLVDVWGLVVNESLACGTPVLGSKYSGAIQELIINDTYGDIIDPNNLNDFTNKLKNLLLLNREKPKEQLQNHIAQFNFQQSSKAILDAIKSSY